MRKLRMILAALTFGVASPALAQAPAPAPASQDPLIATIDGHFQRYMADQHVPGLIYGIVRDGKLVHTTTMGVQELEQRRPVNADTLFRIASMSKAFTALAILKLRDEGKLQLDALAETYIPEMKGWRYPTSDSPRIRVRDLLSHVGGLVTDDPWGDRQTPLPEAEFTKMIRDGVPFTRPPQTQYEYSNFGYALLGRIVTNVSGRPFEDYIQAEIMRPLGMQSTGYDVSRSPQERRALGYRWENGTFAREPDMARGAFGAMGGVQTSANDYAKWVAFLLSAWPPRDAAEQGPVHRATVRELSQGLNFLTTRTRAPLEGGQPCRAALAYAKGFNVSADCDLGMIMFHGGGYPGYGSYLLLMPNAGVGVFAFANRTYAGPSPPVVMTALELQKAGWITPRTIPVSPALADAYRAAGASYRAGNLDPAKGKLAMNFLMDRSAENWARELTSLKAQTGTCAASEPITATGVLAGRFAWTCEKGRIEGDLLLAPTNPPTIQAFQLRVAPAQ